MGQYVIKPDRYVELTKISKQITDLILSEKIISTEICALSDITKGMLKASGYILNENKL